MPEEPHAVDAPADAAEEVDPDEQRAPLDAPAVPFLGRRANRRPIAESVFVRIIATCGIVGLAVAIAAILGTQSIEPWIVGLVASVLSVVLAAILWSSRTL